MLKNRGDIFQFQYGSIESKDSGVTSHIGVVFQFQYGSIERDSSSQAIFFDPEFQFQYGSIESLLSMSLFITLINFNSSMVRLREIYHRERLLHRRISIPVWFD